jgi:hypothetical protein
MRLRGQTAKIEGGFVLFPKEAHWLDTYLLELVTFPNSKNDDQVDSTVYALAWSTLHSAVPGIYNITRMRLPALYRTQIRKFWFGFRLVAQPGFSSPEGRCQFR